MRTIVIATICCALNTAALGNAERIVAISTSNTPVAAINPDRLSPPEKAVLAADADWARAYHTCDLPLMDKVLHPDIMFIHAHGRVDTKQQFMKQVSNCMNDQILVEPLRVVVLGTETAVLEAALTIRQKRVADPVQTLFTRVYVRHDGQWQMIAHQTTRNPGVDGDGKPLPSPALTGTGSVASPADQRR